LHRYWQLTKPKVVAAILFTALVGMLLATPAWPRYDLVVFGCAGIWLAAASAAALNHVLDARLDVAMMRTRWRPLPSGQLTGRAAVAFASCLAVASLLVLALGVNLLAATLTLASLIGYSVVYTVLINIEQLPALCTKISGRHRVRLKVVPRPPLPATRPLWQTSASSVRMRKSTW
jgi:heme o synthase